MQPAEDALAIPKVKPADRLGAVTEPAARGDADLSNVIVLSHRRRTGDIEAPTVSVNDNERPAPDTVARDRRAPWTAVLAGVLLLHSALVLAFMRDPTPLASVGLESISVELVLGTNQAAGVAEKPSESESVPAPDSALSKLSETRAEPEREPEKAVEREPEKPAEPVEPDPKAAVVETGPKPAEAQIEVAEAAKVAEVKTTEPVAETKPATPAAIEKPKPIERPAPKNKAAAARRVASVASAGSSGIGQGRSSRERNYPGMVAAHLARHKQYPLEARARGIGGVASVTFSLDGGGRVTAVRLTRSSGVASLDAETQAMVRRASPFPAPPSGQGMRFTVPVSFNLR